MYARKQHSEAAIDGLGDAFMFQEEPEETTRHDQQSDAL